MSGFRIPVEREVPLIVGEPGPWYSLHVRGNTAPAKPKTKMQAIITHYLPATNTRCSRIKASCARGSVIISYDSGYSDERAHTKAADELVNKFVTEDVEKYHTLRAANPWNRRRVVGQLPSGDHAHVFVG